MNAIAAPSLDGVSTQRLVEEIDRRDQIPFALRLIRERRPWWRRRFQLGSHVWGLSLRWLCFRPWNGDTARITLPFLYFGVGTKAVEMSLGKGKYLVSFEIRWRWE